MNMEIQEANQFLGMEIQNYVPEPILKQILFLLNPKSLCCVFRTCKNWHQFSNDELIWKYFCEKFLPFTGSIAITESLSWKYSFKLMYSSLSYSGIYFSIRPSEYQSFYRFYPETRTVKLLSLDGKISEDIAFKLCSIAFSDHLHPRCAKMLKEIGISINNEVLLQQGIFLGYEQKKGKKATLAHGTYVIEKISRIIANSKDEDSGSEDESEESEENDQENKGNTESANKFWKQKKEKKESTEVYQAHIVITFDLDNQQPIFIIPNKKHIKKDSSRIRHGLRIQHLQTAPGSLLTVDTFDPRSNIARIPTTKYTFKHLQFMEAFEGHSRKVNKET